MSINGNIARELISLKHDIVSTKVAERNKSVDRLNVMLTSNIQEIFYIMIDDEDYSDLTYSSLFSAAVESITQHCQKLDPTTRGFQTSVNKNGQYATMLYKIVESGLQCQKTSNNIRTFILYQGIVTLIKNRTAREHFCSIILNVIEESLFSEKKSILMDLKTADYIELISSIFTLASKTITNPYSALKCAVKGLEYGAKCLQCTLLFLDTLEALQDITLEFANDENSLEMIIKLNLIVLTELAVHGHKKVLAYYNKMIELFCGWYNHRMRPETKQDLFELYLLHYIVYVPNNPTEAYEPISESKSVDWEKINRKLFCIVETEVKEKYTSISTREERRESFENFAAKVVQMMYILKKDQLNTDNQSGECSSTKLQKISTPLEDILNQLDKNNRINVFPVWFTILVKFLLHEPELIDITSYQRLLNRMIWFVESNFDIYGDVRSVRHFSEMLLKQECRFTETAIFDEHWLEFYVFIYNELSQFADPKIREETLEILCILIKYEKVNLDTCIGIVKRIMDEKLFYHKYYLKILRQMLLVHGPSVITKNSLEHFFEQIYTSTRQETCKTVFIDQDSLTYLAEISVLLLLNNFDRQLIASDEPTHLPLFTKRHLQIIENIQYKYVRRFIPIESRKRVATKQLNEDVVMHNKMYMNEKHLEYLMKNSDFQLEDLEEVPPSLMRNLCKFEKLIALIHIFAKFNIIGTGTETCLLKKRFGLLLQTICGQIRSFPASRDILTMESKESLAITKKFLYIFVTLKKIKWFDYCDQYCSIVSGFFEAILDSLNRMQTWEAEQFDDLKLYSLQILATLTEYNGLKANAFKILKQRDSDLFLMKNVDRFFDVLHHLIRGNEFLDSDVPTWILEHLEIICKKYHNNLTISTKIIDSLLLICKSFKHFPDNISDLFVILSSFLKICYKSKFNAAFNRKVLLLFKDIAKLYPELVLQNEDICELYATSIGKFFESASLIVKYSVIECISYLLDPTLLFNASSISNEYIEFSKKLYNSINWISILKSNQEDDAMDKDEKTNINSAVIQLFFTLFGFSYFNGHLGFLELADYCKNNNLSRIHFNEKHIREFAKFFGCDFGYLIADSKENLISFWIKQNFKLDEIPWFLVCREENAFYKDNMPTLIFTSLKHCKKYIAEISKKTDMKSEELLMVCMAKCYAFTLPYSSKVVTENSNYVTVNSDYMREAQNVLNNLRDLNVKFDSVAKSIEKYDVMYELFCQFSDNKKFEDLVSLKTHFSNIEDISFEILNKTLCYLTEGKLSSYVLKNPYVIIKLNEKLKSKIFKTELTKEKLLWICRYYTLIHLLEIKDISNEIHWFLAKDSICFITAILKRFHTNFWIFSATIRFAENFLQTFVSSSDQLEDAIFVIINQVIEIAESESQVKQKLDMCLRFLENLFCSIIESKNQLLGRIEPLMEKDIFAGTSVEIHCAKVPSLTKKSIAEDLMDFAESKFKNAHLISKLSLNISKKKKQFIELTQKAEEVGNIKSIFNILTKIITTGTAKEAQSAADCLGVIGPVFISKYAFTNESSEDHSFGSNKSFESSVLKAMEKILFCYDYKSYSLILLAADFITNSPQFENHSKNQKFLKPFCRDAMSSNEIEFLLKNELDLNRILCENANQQCFEIFLKRLTSKLFQALGLAAFENLSSESFEFAQCIIVPLFENLLEHNKSFANTVLQMLEYFFKEANDAVSNASPFKTNFLNKRTIKLMLDISELYRIQNKYNIEINQLHVANVAAYQQAYFLSILYLELWALNQKSSTTQTKYSNEDLLRDKSFQQIALTTFKAINCKDAIKGFLDPVESQIEYFNNENDLMDIIIEMDAADNVSNSKILNEALKRNGLLSLSGNLQQTTDVKDEQIDYEILWRLGDWNAFLPESSSKECSKNYLENLECQFEKNHYACLKAIRYKDETSTKRTIEVCKNIVNQMLRETSIESVQSFYKHLTNLMLVRQIEDFSLIQYVATANCGFRLSTSDEVLKNWDLEYDMTFGDFTNKERLMAQRLVLFEVAGTRGGRKILEYNGSSIIAKYLLSMIEDCNRSNLAGENINLAKRYLSKLKKLSDVSDEIKAKTELINADICMQNGRKSTALTILRKIVREPSNENTVLYHIDANRLTGKYLAEANDEVFEDIYKNHFLKASNMLDKLEALVNKGNFKKLNRDNFLLIRKNLYKNIAEFADREYQQVDSYIKSDEYQKSIEIMHKHRSHAEIMKKNMDRNAPNFVAENECYSVLSRNANLDAKNIEHFQQSRLKYLELALKNYIEYSKMDDAVQSPVIYRIISLWFSNKNMEELHQIIDNAEIPSFKFINVLSQLTAQLNSNVRKFVEVLKKIIIKCALDYPHHTLNHIICLHTSNEDLAYFGQSKPSTSQSDLRLQRVKQILEQLGRDKACSEIIKQMQQMFINLIECAYWNMPKPKSRDSLLAKDYLLSDKLRKMKNLNKVHCPTIQLDIIPITNANFRHQIVSVIGWDPKYELAGGINAPKKINCNCSDGIKRPQLLKGNDDMRQDAIMQHVLTFVNSLLKHNKDNTDLSIRTYKVTPLSKRSGILEWCTNTTTLSHFLCGTNKASGAHAKYRPSDKPPVQCRAKLAKYKTAPPEIRINAFKEVCQSIQPVLHYFFFERFTTPGVWFERRLAYMNSVATSSMIGYILGLGDRHCQNILLDERTAEVIHIDFGIAFEKGKVMPTPEKVPFRLTREMVAPMGVCQVNGIFKKSCEQTLQILRDNQQVLLTILEVLLYDPLYSWSLNEKIIKRIKDDYDGSVNINEQQVEDAKNSSAHRALAQVQSKLEGRMDKHTGVFSVPTHVDKLIAEARSVANLALLFPGWDQYL